MKLRVGDDFHGDPVPRNDELIDQFVVVDAAGRRQVVGREGADPAGLLRVTAPGLMVIGYQSRPSPVTLPGREVHAVPRRRKGSTRSWRSARARGQPGARAGKMFSRSAKSLVRSGTVAAGAGDRALGFPIELVAERNPYEMRRGETLPVRLTYGRPRWPAPGWWHTTSARRTTRSSCARTATVAPRSPSTNRACGW